MKVDIKEIKTAFLKSNTQSFEDLERMLLSIDISISDIVLAIKPKEAEEYYHWLEFFSTHFNSKKLSSEAYNHFFSITDLSLLHPDVFLNIKILNTNNLERLKIFLEHNNPRNVLSIVLVHEEDLGQDFVIKKIENLKNSLYNELIMIVKRQEIPKKYFKAISENLSLENNLHIFAHLGTVQYFSLLKGMCIQKQTSVCKFIASQIKPSKTTCYNMSVSAWKTIINKESVKELTFLFDKLNEYQKYQQLNVNKEIIVLYEKKVIEEEKKLLLKDIVAPKHSNVVKI